MKLPILKAFFASFAYVAMRIGDVLRANWLGVLLLHGAMIVLMPRYLEPMIQAQLIDPNADPTAVFSAMGPALQWLALLYLVMAIIYPMLIVGNLRPLLRGETPSLPFYLNFGMDELRVLITFILWVALTLITAVVGLVALISVSAALSAISPAIGGTIATIGVSAVTIAFIWFLLRMSLVYPATIAERQIGLPHSWRVTKGNSWRLFVFWFLWVLVFIVLALIYSAIILPGYMGVVGELIAAGEDQIAQQAASAKINQMQLDMWDISQPGGVINIAFSSVYTLITIALWNIAAGTAYRYLTEGAAKS